MFEFITDLFSSKPPALDQEATPPPPPPAPAPAPPQPKAEGDDPNAAPALLWACHTVLAAAKSPRADDVLTRAQSVLTERAGLLDEADRATFLGNVPAHRAITTAWAATSKATSAP